jgi:hypothetical protein
MRPRAVADIPGLPLSCRRAFGTLLRAVSHAQSGRHASSKRLGLVLAAAMFACVGCGRATLARRQCASDLQGVGIAPAAAMRQGGQAGACARVPLICRSVAPRRPGVSQASLEPPGSCSRSDLSALLAAVARFRRTVMTSGDICALFTPYYRANAERWAHEQLPPVAPTAVRRHQTCSAVAMYFGNATRYRGTELLREVLMFPASKHAAFESRVGPAPRGAIVIFAPAANDPGLNVVVVATGRGWLIDQIGYEF